MSDPWIVSADRKGPRRITITTVALVADEDAGLPMPREVQRARVGRTAGLTARALPHYPPARPARSGLRRWSPLGPFRTVRDNYAVTREALGTGGRMSIVYLCLVAGAASVVWRHYSLPIGIAGGLLVAAIMFVRTGAYREYTAAIADAHGMPSVGVVVRYNLACLSSWIRARWRP